MKNEEIMAGITAVFQETLDQPNLVLRPETTASDVEDWDSLSHVQLVVAVEKRFRVRFAAKEIQGFKNIGEMRDAVARNITI